MRHISAKELRSLLPMVDAIDALEHAFAGDRAETPQRSVLETGTGHMLLMPAVGSRSVGVKLVTVAPGNATRNAPVVQGVYVLFAADDLRPLATIDGAALTVLRTAAVSGLATRLLARGDAERLVLFGAGAQACGHLKAMAAVRPIRSVVIVSRRAGEVGELATIARRLGLETRTGAPADVADADLVCTCTSSPEPVFDGTLLAPGVHLNAIGAYTPSTREVDDEAVRDSLVVVETREAALAEAGDLLQPITSGLLDPAGIRELGEVVRGTAGRRSEGERTLFKSVGVAFEDLAIAEAILARAEIRL